MRAAGCNGPRLSSTASAGTTRRRSRRSPSAPGLTERTYFRYFADKREVLFYGSGQLQERLVAGIASAPDGLSPLGVVGAALEAAAAPFEEAATSRGDGRPSSPRTRSYRSAS